MKGYKVVNYVRWESLPNIFVRIKDAKEAKKNWKFGNDAIIEYFNSRKNRVKQFVDK
jgi:hypothetical protein